MFSTFSHTPSLSLSLLIPFSNYSPKFTKTRKNRATMREKGKKILQTHTNFTDFNFSAPDSICKVHKNSPPIGICPICLRDKLKNLICSVCGQQNTFFSCNCSDLIRNSSSSDVGSVGRISFLIENENLIPIFKTETGKKIGFKKTEKQKPNCKEPSFDHDHEDGLKKNIFKTFLRKFLKKNDKSFSERNKEVLVSRSRSLCSFRDSSEFAFSSAKNSDYCNSSSERASNFSENEHRKNSFENKGTKVKKNREVIDFVNIDDSAFIELTIREDGFDNGEITRGGSCRVTEREMRREKRGKKVWGWILKHNSSSSWRSKKDEASVFRD